jgi:hypothetical protein
MAFEYLLLVPMLFFGMLIFIAAYREAKTKLDKALLIGVFF